MLRNTSLQLVDTTLREGEQFALAHFTSEDRLRIARGLDAFGIDYIEMTSPAASPQSAADLARIASLGLRARVVTHTRCHLRDVQLAMDCGVQGINLLFGSSPWLRRFSHGRSLDGILEQARDVIAYLRARSVEIRFSCEDAFRTPLHELRAIYREVCREGVDRIGIADTIGVATPNQVTEVVSAIRDEVDADIEFHGHDDSGCAVANAFAAFEAGATHIDTTILGIGERNGIAPLSSLVARFYVSHPDVLGRYRLDQLASLDSMVSELVGVPIPFNACITGSTAFTHKAGLHTKAVLREPRTYEAMAPETFGRRRDVLAGHRLTGRHVLADRARQLGLSFDDTRLRQITAKLKGLADHRPLEPDEIDRFLAREATPPKDPC